VLVFDFLPAMADQQLSDAPLVVAVAQVRFNHQNVLSKHSGASQFQEALGDEYPRLLAEQQANIVAGHGHFSSDSTPQWRLTDLDNAWSCVVAPEAVTIETTAYSAWSVMRERVSAAIGVLEEVAHPRVRERIGLRYINHLRPSAGGDYAGIVDAPLLGLVGVPERRAALAMSVGQALFRDGDTQLVLRYGVARTDESQPESESFMIDIDVADEQPRKFHGGDALGYFDQLNNAALRCFASCLAEPYRDRLFDGGGTV
jgi:uncharacterized protein (TIGR04255 family)